MGDTLSAEGVSYVMTVYNKAAYLPDVLDAVAREHAMTGGEIILVDDGSTDDSPRLLKEFAARVTGASIITQPNRGVAAATNLGIGRAVHPYLRLVDADDVLVVGSTQLLQAALCNTGHGFAYGRYAHQEGESPSGDIIPVVITDPLRTMLTCQPFIPATSLGVTATMRRALPLPEQFRTCQDFSLGLRLAALTPFVSIAADCCITPRNSAGLSAAKGLMYRDTVLIALVMEAEQRWPAALKRLVLSRNLGRARNYARRHGPKLPGHVIALSLLAPITRIPLPWPFRRLMLYIVDFYESR